MESVKQNKINRRLWLIGGFIFLMNLLPFNQAGAANLALSPNSGTYTKGQNLAVSIFVSSADQAMNAAGGTLSFPSDKLQVISIDKSGTIINLWAQEPTFSNKTGAVNFEGIVMNPGYTGRSGKIITVNFKTIASGVADLKFNSGSVLANDGQGTNILQALGTARFFIETEVSGPASPEAETPPEAIGTPAAPKISSASHPDPNAWYNKTAANFSWTLPSDITGVRLLISNKPQDIPTVNYQGAINTKEVNDLTDGVWYLHVRLKNNLGWGGVSHFRFQIDTKKPRKLEIKPFNKCRNAIETDINNANPAIAENNCENEFQSTFSTVVKAADDESGIKQYNIKIDDQDLGSWTDPGDGIYTTPGLRPGQHTLRIEAVDQAGNTITEFIDFTITASEAPQILFFPDNLDNNDRLVIEGQYFPKGKLIIWLQKEDDKPQTFMISTNHIGRFTFVYGDKLSNGVYTFWIESLDDQGIVNSTTAKNNIVVRQTNFLRIGSLAIDFLSIIIPIIALLCLLTIILICSRRKIKNMRCSISGQASQADSLLHDEIVRIKRRLAGHIRNLEIASAKRTLTSEEKSLIKSFTSELDVTEEKISKKIQDIKKSVRKNGLKPAKAPSRPTMKKPVRSKVRKIF